MLSKAEPLKLEKKKKKKKYKMYGIYTFNAKYSGMTNTQTGQTGHTKIQRETPPTRTKRECEQHEYERATTGGPSQTTPASVEIHAYETVLAFIYPDEDRDSWERRCNQSVSHGEPTTFQANIFMEIYTLSSIATVLLLLCCLW